MDLLEIAECSIILDLILFIINPLAQSTLPKGRVQWQDHQMMSVSQLGLLQINNISGRQYYMRGQLKAKGFTQQEPKYREIDEFYDPLKQVKPIQSVTSTSKAYCITLFDDNDNFEEDYDDFIVKAPQYVPPEPKEESPGINEDPFLKKIFANSKNQPKPRQKQTYEKAILPELEPFCFNTNIILKYPQTPHFKNQLQSPFWKFNAEHRTHMQILRQKTIKCDFGAIDLNSDPLNFVSEKLRYLVGISLNLKEKECVNASRALLKLGCYVQPFNQKAWKKYIQSQEQYGYIYKAFILSKTAFLFTQNEEFAKGYLSFGQKCGVALGQMRGILNSSDTPEQFEKGVLVEIGKLALKHQQVWKGLKILFQICQWNDFRLPVCALVIFLAKYLENIGQRDKALGILKRSFGRGMSKLQIYTTYLEMKVRQEKGVLREALIKEILDYSEFISSQNRYRLYLQIAELLFRRNDLRYKYYIQQSFQAAKKYCAPGTGCNKTLRHIYYTVLKWKNLPPPRNIPSDTTFIEANRYQYILNGTLKIYQFTDWKYYLHYGLLKKTDLLLEASKKWSYTGRLIAEWIHSLRDSLSPKEVLKVWRQKIDEVPKSGQLWCEGGRIYAQLGEYENASKCFKAAIHFTPQFGDSFIQQLRLYLMRGQLMQIHKLKKLTLVSEPFYGHVWSFLRESSPADTKMCLIDMWELATLENIKLSKPGDKDYRLLTAYAPYNQAHYNPSTPEIRKKLFASYEQLDSKN